MPSQSKDDYLTKAEMMAWSRFLNSTEGQKGLLYLRLGCKRAAGEGDNTLIKNAVGFEYWQKCVDALESLGEVPKRQEREPDDALEQ
jgi:hypothetical protein